VASMPGKRMLPTLRVLWCSHSLCTLQHAQFLQSVTSLSSCNFRSFHFSASSQQMFDDWKVISRILPHDALLICHRIASPSAMVSLPSQILCERLLLAMTHFISSIRFKNIFAFGRLACTLSLKRIFAATTTTATTEF
jgi:hypothetical protein